jgi:hypothetical protein
MNLRAILASKVPGSVTIRSRDESSRSQSFGAVVSRRRFAHQAAGAAGLGMAVRLQASEGNDWHDRHDAHDRHRIKFPWTFAPVPIPKGTPGLGGDYHIFGPSPATGSDPVDAEPSTITDFKGFVGLAYISGNVTQTNKVMASDLMLVENLN